MRIRKGIIAIMLLGVMLFAAAGCGSKAADNEPVSQNTAQKAKVFVDHMGKEVEMPSNPQRILALNPFMMENLFVLGITPVGRVEDYTYRPEGVALPSVGMQKNINLEAIYDLKPDLIFAQVTFHGGMRESLEATGAKVVFIDSKKTEGATFGVLNFMGEALGKQAEAEAYIKKIDQLSAQIKEKTSASPLKTCIMLLGGTDGVYAFHPNSFPADIVKRVGLQNLVSPDLPLSKDSGVGSAINYDIETIIKQDPDVLIIRSGSTPGDGSGAGQGQGQGKGKGQGQAKSQGQGKDADAQAIVQKYYNDPLYKDLRAVKNGHVYLLPGSINPGTISIEEAMQITAKIIYPELFN